jgi:hypothetical protein
MANVRLVATVVLPVPPLPLATAMIIDRLSSPGPYARVIVFPHFGQSNS